MIIKLDINEITNLINEVTNRNLNFIKIEKKANEYYAEYNLGFNKSDIIFDLLSELEVFKQCYEKGTINHFYLWYNVAVDKIISNTQTIMLEEQRASKLDIIEKLTDVKELISEKQGATKITFTEGKKKVNVDIETIINLLIYKLK